MSEKRFYLDENGINDKEYEFSLLGEDELVDIINRIVDENEQLKREVKEKKDFLINFCKYMHIYNSSTEFFIEEFLEELCEGRGGD